MTEKILIAIDNSPSAMNAANYGIKFAKKIKAQVGVIYVTNYSIGNIEAGVLPNVVEQQLQQRHDILMDEINITHPAIEIHEFDPIGRPEKEIENIISLWKPNLLIIGHHTHGFLETLFGHHTEKRLIHHLKIPLLLVPEKIIN
ncbi:universal stress protein [Pontimicrobium sp. MEBiC01747]